MWGVLAAIITAFGACIAALISKLRFEDDNPKTKCSVCNWILLLSVLIVLVFLICFALYIFEDTSKNISDVDLSTTAFPNNSTYATETVQVETPIQHAEFLETIPTNTGSAEESTTLPTTIPIATQETEPLGDTIVVSVNGSDWTFVYDKGYLIGEVMIVDYNAFDPRGNIQYGLSIVLDDDIGIGSYGYVSPSSKVNIIFYYDYYDGYFHDRDDCEAKKATVNITSRNDEWTEYKGNFDVTVGNGSRFSEKYKLICDCFRFSVDKVIDDDSQSYIGAGYVSGSWRYFKEMNGW